VITSFAVALFAIFMPRFRATVFVIRGKRVGIQGNREGCPYTIDGFFLFLLFLFSFSFFPLIFWYC
jgi:hypothetical protein